MFFQTRVCVSLEPRTSVVKLVVDGETIVNEVRKERKKWAAKKDDHHTDDEHGKDLKTPSIMSRRDQELAKTPTDQPTWTSSWDTPMMHISSGALPLLHFSSIDGFLTRTLSF